MMSCMRSVVRASKKRLALALDEFGQTRGARQRIDAERETGDKRLFLKLARRLVFDLAAVVEIKLHAERDDQKKRQNDEQPAAKCVEKIHRFQAAFESF